MPALVAIIDDDPSLRAALTGYVQALGYRTIGFSSADAFLDGETAGVTCVVSDIQMPGLSGVDLVARMGRRHQDIPVILITARTETAVLNGARRCGAFRLLAKPFDPDDLDRCLREAIEAAR